MASLKHLKARLRATHNIHQITKAIEMVSVNKMRRSQTKALAARPFSFAAMQILLNFSASSIESMDIVWFNEPLHAQKTMLIVLASDKGLCGSFNAGILKIALEFYRTHTDVEIVAVGKKAVSFFAARGVPIVWERESFGDAVVLDDVRDLADFVTNAFARTGEYKSVYAAYSKFISSFLNHPAVMQILPSSPEALRETLTYAVGAVQNETDISLPSAPAPYNFDVPAEALLNQTIPFLLEAQLYHIILETNAAEHSSRLLAMKNASDNSKNLHGRLQMAYNKTRQAIITRHIIEVASSKEVMDNA